MRCPIYQARLVEQGVAWQRQEIDQFILCGYLIHQTRQLFAGNKRGHPSHCKSAATVTGFDEQT